MAAFPVLRSVRRLRGEVTLLPRIVISPRRTESGGKGAERAGVSKTLVSFPEKQPHVWPSMRGENAAHPSTILHQLDRGRESSVDSEKERSEPGQDHSSSSSSSSSDSSDSDSDQEEAEERKEAGEAPKDSSNQNLGSKHQKTGRPETREREDKKAGEDLADVTQSLDTKVQSPTNQSNSGGKNRSGDQDLPIQDLVEVAPAVDTLRHHSGKKTSSGGQDLSGEDLVDVAPDVNTQIQRPLAFSQSEGKTRGGQDIRGEGLVDVAPTVDIQVQSPHNLSQSEGKTCSGDQDLLGEDLVDVAPTIVTEKPGPDEAQTLEWAEEAAPTMCQDQDSREMTASDGNKDPPGQPSGSSPCDQLPPEGSLTPPPPSAAPTQEEPFDNSKYHNQQHFSYTPFTFVDLDVDLLKYRLPQPSSGRPSPRH